MSARAARNLSRRVSAPPSVAALDVQIGDACECLVYVTTGIFGVSLFLALLRPDPTIPVCLLGLYGAHVRSPVRARGARRAAPPRARAPPPVLRARTQGALRSFWLFLLLTVGVDGVWLLQYSALSPLTLEQLGEMTRPEQIAVALTAVNALYKLVVVTTAFELIGLLGRREAAQNDAAGDAAACGGGGGSSSA